MKQFIHSITGDLNRTGVTVTRVEITRDEVVIDISLVDSCDEWEEEVERTALVHLLDVVRLQRSKSRDCQTFIFYIK